MDLNRITEKIIGCAIMILLCMFTATANSLSPVSEYRMVQDMLAADEVALEYMLTDSVVHIFAVSHESVVNTEQSVDSFFWENLHSFRDKMRSAEIREFGLPAEVLYLFLIQPVHDFIAGKKRLIIFPGEKLSGVPFEAFINNSMRCSSGKPGGYNYLIREFEIVYQDGGAPIIKPEHKCNEKSADKGKEKQYGFIGFSPATSLCPGLASLPASQIEIEKIRALFHQRGIPAWGEYPAENCTACIEDSVGIAIIVHLATHNKPGRPGSARGGLLVRSSPFDPDRFTEYELLFSRDSNIQHHLAADLLVLNGCATATSQVQSGLTLPQYCMNAGAQNIISTLWNVTDELSCLFMIDFYRTWLTGMTYGEALREVKLKWLSRSSTSIPTIWAPYILHVGG
jgi:CHAT domain-containing protein